MAKAVRIGCGDEAWKICEEWRTGKIGFEEARRKLARITRSKA